jgi:hypothetical protein
MPEICFFSIIREKIFRATTMSGATQIGEREKVYAISSSIPSHRAAVFI